MKIQIGESIAAGAILKHKKKLKEALRDHYRRFGSIEQLKLLVELTEKVNIQSAVADGSFYAKDKKNNL